ncbi:MAG: hypothetical protein Aurels2KO_31350 [Aureliella sp.]
MHMQWQPSSRAVTVETLDRELSGNRFSILHFWASWNNVDKLMDADLRAIRPDICQEIAFLSMNTDREDAWDFIRSCRIMNLPALGFFKGPAHVDTLSGRRDPDALIRKIQEWSNEDTSN